MGERERNADDEREDGESERERERERERRGEGGLEMVPPATMTRQVRVWCHSCQQHKTAQVQTEETQLLQSIFTQGGVPGGPHGNVPGNLGDFVFHNEALERVLNQLAENHVVPTVPASQEEIA